MQQQLRALGEWCCAHSGKVLFVAALVLATLAVGLKSARVVVDVEKLWVEGELEEQCNILVHFVFEMIGVYT